MIYIPQIMGKLQFKKIDIDMNKKPAKIFRY